MPVNLLLQRHNLSAETPRSEKHNLHGMETATRHPSSSGNAVGDTDLVRRSQVSFYQVWAVQTWACGVHFTCNNIKRRPSSGAVQVLSYKGHAPVSSIAWCPTGDDLLLATSAFSSALVVSNVVLLFWTLLRTFHFYIFWNHNTFSVSNVR